MEVVEIRSTRRVALWLALSVKLTASEKQKHMSDHTANPHDFWIDCMEALWFPNSFNKYVQGLGDCTKTATVIMPTLSNCEVHLWKHFSMPSHLQQYNLKVLISRERQK